MKTFNDFLTELNRFEKEKGTDTKTGKPITKGGTAKGDKVFQSVMKKYGSQRMGANQPKKVKGQKSTSGTGKYKKLADDRKQLKKDAKEMGYGSDTKGYVETRARYGSKENMKSGRGLGT